MRYAFHLFCFLCLTLQPLWAAPLNFSQTELTMEAPLGEKTLVARFQFMNSSTEGAKIVRSESTCSCMTIRTKEGKWSYSPGESGVLEAAFEIGNYQGTVEKTLRLWLEGDAGDKPSHILQLKVIIPELIQLDAKTLRWEAGEATGAKTARITFNGDKPRFITQVTGSDPNFTHTVTEVLAGKSYDIVVTCHSTQSRTMGVVRVETEGEIGGPRTTQLFAVVR